MMKDSYLMLTLLILDSQASSKDMDVFLRPMIDELKDLWVIMFSQYMLPCCRLLMISLLKVVVLGRMAKVTKPA